MKDVISILQSKIAKRSRVISSRTTSRWVMEFGEKVLKAPMYNHNHPRIVHLAEQQKQDKRILAEIVQLRREAKQQQRVKAISEALERCEEMSEQEVLEMENKVLAARWGE